jgi:multiple sugar transport system ATP-binding protein
MSGGQRQRVAIGRAITRSPDVFLFDEPLSNLDAALRTQMRVELSTLHAQLGATMIYVTHDQVEAMTMASRIVVLNGGRIEQMGAPLDLYSNPANLFVAGFLGAPRMNFVRGTVAEVSGRGASVACAGGLTVVFDDLAVPASRGETVTVGIRPEKLVIDKIGSAFTCNGQVRLTEYLGRETIIYVDAGDLTTTGSDSGTGAFTAQIGDIRPFEIGTSVSIGFDARDAYLFANDGRTISSPKPVASL